MECIVQIQTHSKMSVLEGICSHLSFSPQNNGAATPTPTPTAASLPCDDFFVDELLNLNNHEDDICEDYDHKFDLLLLNHQQQFQTHPADSFSPTPSLVSPPLHSVLSVPEEEEADLEWLSHFVEDCFTQFSTPYPAGFAKPRPRPRPRPTWPSFAPAKARRSKRARTGGRLWSAWVSGPEFKKQKRGENGLVIGGSALGSPRRCSHCGVQKTPQWRAGPMGPKTLCNACGVRYKSGRLLPEYRPACSPTFSSELHSNSHRKVLEMRKQKEEEVVPGLPESETISDPSFG